MAAAFEPKTVTSSAVFSNAYVAPRRFEPARISTTPRIRGGSKFDKKQDDDGIEGGDGSLTWESCEGEEEFVIEWQKGRIITSGGYKIIAGCEGGGGGS